MRAILRALDTTKDGTLSGRFFLDILGRGFTEDEARAQLDTAIDWARYGELFDYDADNDELLAHAVRQRPGGVRVAPSTPGLAREGRPSYTPTPRVTPRRGAS